MRGREGQVLMEGRQLAVILIEEVDDWRKKRWNLWLRSSELVLPYNYQITLVEVDIVTNLTQLLKT